MTSKASIGAGYWPLVAFKVAFLACENTTPFNGPSNKPATNPLGLNVLRRLPLPEAKIFSISFSANDSSKFG